MICALSRSRGSTQTRANVILTKNEILASLGASKDYILAIVPLRRGLPEAICVRRFAESEFGFAEMTVTFDLAKLIAIGKPGSREIV